jgi:hypothetical protein
VHHDQLRSDVFSKQRFPVSFMLAPPVLEAQTAREMFERGYLMDLQDACGNSFIEFGKAVCAAREMRETAQGLGQTNRPLRASVPLRSGTLGVGAHAAAVASARTNVLGTSTTLSNQYSILGRHRLQKIRDDEKTATASSGNGMGSMGIPQFLKRMSIGSMNKS